MSNYVVSVDFAAKDALASGNAGKVIKGTEIDAEFDAIAVAVATKADAANAALTGTPTTGGIEIGYRKVPAVTSTGETLATTHVGKVLVTSGNMTVPNSTFAAGDAVSIYNNSASPITITASVGTLRQAGTTATGNRTLAARGLATVLFISATEAVVSGAGLS